MGMDLFRFLDHYRFVLRDESRLGCPKRVESHARRMRHPHTLWSIVVLENSPKKERKPNSAVISRSYGKFS